MIKSELIGLLGGMSWESSALYYRLLNLGVNRELGGHHNARSVLFTLDYEELLSFASTGRWDLVGEVIAAAAVRVEHAGAAVVLITASTGHAVADQVEAALNVPLLHIADPTGRAVAQAGISRVGLLGTRFTMEMDFLPRRFRRQHGLEVLIREPADRLELHRIIVDELTLGIVKEDSQGAVLRIARDMRDRGAEGIIIGCTELPLLLEVEQYPLPAFDLTRLHVEAAIEIVLEKGQ